MKEAVIPPGLKVEVIDTSASPTPRPFEVIIKVVVASTNPIDWKSTSREEEIAIHGELEVTGYNSTGKDVAGFVYAVGSEATDFKVGDRVDATNHGSGYAEYSVGPCRTTYRIPDSVSFEEASTYGLPYITAALSLYHHMRLSSPWTPSQTRTPVIVYGAGSAVGAFAIKLLNLSSIHPILAVAGASSGYVKSLLDSTKGDTVFDYRQGEEKLLTSFASALKEGEKVKYALETISITSTINFLALAVDPEAGVLHIVLNYEGDLKFPSGVEVNVTFAPDLWLPISEAQAAGKRDVITNREAGFVYYKYLEYALANKLIAPHPFEIIPGGLGVLKRD